MGQRGWKQTRIVQNFGTQVAVGVRNDQMLKVTALKFKS
jgi:hypothetical protein